MKIVLVVILGGDLVRSTEHLGVGYIASYLRQNQYNVDIIEIIGVDDKKNIEKLLKTKYDLVGFTTTCVSMKNILVVAELVKKVHPTAHLTLGGHMATFWGSKILKEYRFIDSVIRGEGEITMLELVKILEKNETFKDINGLTYREKDQIIENRDRELIKDLDKLPFPSRDQFHMHNNRFQYIRICSSRGCLGNCGFCSSFVGRKQADFKWRGRSPENVVDEIEQIVKKYDFHTYDFTDSTFEDPGELGKKRIKEIAQEIINRKLSIFYNCCFRAENWHEEDRKLLEILIESGLEKVNIGFEAGNDRGLRLLNKRATMEDNKNVIKLLSDYPDIYITFGFIMFHPYSSMEDIKENAQFLFDTGIGQVIRHYFWQLEIYPSTLMEQKLIKDKMVTQEYNICDGMYEYEFRDKTVGKVADICQNFLDVESVWDFEIFDILTHTFITRLRRKYKSNEKIYKEVIGFERQVNDIRAEMAEFNLDFHINIVKNLESINIEKEKLKLNEYIKNRMNHIKDIQLKTGIGLRRRGYDLVKSY